MRHVNMCVAAGVTAAIFVLAIPVSLAFSARQAGAPVRLQSPNGSIRLDVNTKQSGDAEVVSIKVGDSWVPALSSPRSAVRIVPVAAPHTPEFCSIDHVSTIARGLLLQGNCSLGTFQQRILLAPEPDVLHVEAKFVVHSGVKILSVEDRYNFAPGRRKTSTPTSGPVDFVWSQNIKNEADDIVPIWAFKSPVVMLQQGNVFTALMPQLSDRRQEPLALDLEVTSDAFPWLSYGAIAAQPYGHSYFRRSPNEGPKIIAHTIEYAYDIVASDQPVKLGYRRAVRLLWAKEGHKELLRSNDLQQNVLRPQMVTFDQWRKDTWIRYANQVYRGFACGGRRCGTLVSNRNPWGQWNKPAPDAWFNAWFQTLRSAYGWYLYGEHTGNKYIESKAESVLNLALTSPRDGGAFSTIYLVNSKRWLRSDFWAGYGDYHAFDMSWTTYWMLQWATLTPDRRKEILAFVRPYGDFLVQHQLASGVIPSWYDNDLKPRSEFRNFNAGATASSALFLASLSEATGDHVYLDAAVKAMAFIQHEVIPRQRWFDFETFLSCARKPYGFYDPWTAQYPQNNLSQIQAAKAYLELFRTTKNPKYLDLGTRVLDYLLLTQQVWNNPAFSPKVVGGFTVQNTDAEWSDARQGYAAVLLWDYYRATGRQEYLERAVGAARATFAVAPWENWAHTGYTDIPGSLTGFHWGPGSAMTSVEIMSPSLGDAFINLRRKNGAGFNACSLRHIRVDKHVISLDLQTFPASRSVNLRFSGVDSHAKYQIIWNGNRSKIIDGETLSASGYTTPNNLKQ